MLLIYMTKRFNDSEVKKDEHREYKKRMITD